MSKITQAFLLLSLVSIAESFPVRHTSPRRKNGSFSMTSDERIGEEAHVVDTTTEPEPKVDDVPPEDTHALSGLLGEMFEAKLDMSREQKELESHASQNKDMPTLGSDGIYRIISQSQLENFKAANSDKLVFLKFSSPICAACRMLKQKFQTLHRNPKFATAPVVFADIVISNNKKVADPFRDYITTELQVQRVPSIHFHGSGNDAALANIIHCGDDGGCSWPDIQEQMLGFIGKYYSPPVEAVSHEALASSEEATEEDSSLAEETSTTTTLQTPEKKSKRERFRTLISSSLKWVR